MRILNETLKSIIFSTIALLFIAHNVEKGDINAISMYFIVFIIPIIIVSILNGVWLNLLRNPQFSIVRKRILSLIPILLLILMIFLKGVSLPFFDGAVSFVGILGGIGTGINNLIWNFNLKELTDVN